MNQVAETKPSPEPKSKSLGLWSDFQDEIKAREKEITSMLPQNVSRERFINSAVAAVKQNPDLLLCTPRSLFGAITKSAQDGLLSDGREGIITSYNNQQKDNTWLAEAQWNPMTFGLRRRARELDNIIVDAQVVHENDSFQWHQGDAPHIEHRPAQLGQPRGKMIGVYAIFKRGNDILHREVMSAEQVEAVRSQSKAKNSLLWTKFSGEGWRKAVVRRGFKSVPCSDKLQSIVQRDDDLFSFDDAPVAIPPPSPPPAPPAPQDNPAPVSRDAEDVQTVEPVTPEMLVDWAERLADATDEIKAEIWEREIEPAHEAGRIDPADYEALKD